MSKPLVLLSALVAAGILAVTCVLYLGGDSRDAQVRFDQGKTMSRLFVPPASQKEARIERHPHDDGSADDDVWMRDGTTKHIIYDTKMTLRQVFAYYKGKTPDEQGPLMYEKTHNADGHLIAERHLRLDGSLEMDGKLGTDGLYVRHDFYAAASNDARKLVVSSEKVFDMLWKPVSQTDFRPDKTRQLAHVWQKDGSETVSSFKADGQTLVYAETTKDGKNDHTDYMSDGVTVAVETINDSGGTTFKWFRPDHTMSFSVKYTNEQHHEITLANEAGKPIVLQDWEPDYAQKPEGDVFPVVLTRIDQIGADGKVAVRYVYGLNHQLSSVTVVGDGGETYFGARQIYQVDQDGWATAVETYDKDDKSDGGKKLTQADGKRFVLDSSWTTVPAYQMPKLKDGLKLYGDPPYEGPM